MHTPVLDKLSDLDLTSFSVDIDESPTTVVSTLPRLTTPLPPAEDPTWIEFHTSDWVAEREAIEPPAAPMIKDLDSFTDGTGQGSFESILDTISSDEGDLIYHPEDPSLDALGLLPELDPSISHSIEMWREEVSGYGLGAPIMGTADLPEDPIEREALETAESLLGVINLRSEGPEDTVDDGPRIPMFNISLSAPVTASTSRVMKRARSRSPTSQCSRRIRRTRSKSLSAVGQPTELSNIPPWRSKAFLEHYKYPFE